MQEQEIIPQGRQGRNMQQNQPQVSIIRQTRIMPSGGIQRPSEGIGELIQNRKQTIAQLVSDQK
jgi:hypothetical protein